MTKKTFLRKLGSKLDILKEEEKKDIINEYEGHIDEKIKQGKTEQEAVADFGNIDDLTDEILDAYKIKKPNKEDNSKIDNFINEFIYTVKDVLKNIGRNMSEDTVGFIFKILAALLIIGLLRIPFYIVEQIGSSIFYGLTFGPIGAVTVLFWKVIVELAYILVAVLLVASILGKNEKVNEIKEKIINKQNEIKKHSDIVSESKEDAMRIKKEATKIKEEAIKIKNETPKKEEESTSKIPFAEVSIIVLKIFAIIFVVPFVFTQISFVIVFGILIKFTIEGVIIWGLLSIFLGLIFITGTLMKFIIKIAFTPKKLHYGMLVKVIIGFLLIDFGSAALAFDFMNYDYVNESPEHNYSYQTITKSYSLDQITNFSYDYGTYEIIEDETLDNEVVIEINYIEELINLNIKDSEETISMTIDDKDYYFNQIKPIYNLLMEDLKEKVIHNYMKLFAPEYEIYINPEQKDQLEINKQKIGSLNATLGNIYIESSNGDKVIINGN